MSKVSELISSEYKSQMQDLLGADYDKYIAALDEPAVRGLRVNTKRISAADFFAENKNKLGLEKLEFCDDGFVFESDDKIGFSPEHLSGQIYIQEPSSMLAVCASGLEKENRPLRVLDLCAAPGGKTGQIASRVSDDSVIFSNEIIKSRAEILRSNIERLGFCNCVVLNEEPKDLGVFEGYFDYVFVDAPCSGEGMFRKNPETINEWSKNNVEMCANRQKEILTIAEKLVAGGGKLIYSTCTFNKQEDENIVQWFLNSFPFEIKGVDESIKKVTIPAKNNENARKFLPFFSKGEGQFVAVFECVEDRQNKLYSKKHYRCIQQIGQSENKLVKEFSASSLIQDFSWKNLYRVGDNIFFAPPGFDGFMQTALESLKFVTLGVKIGNIERGRFEPNHNIFMAFQDKFKQRIELSDDEFEKYLHGEELARPDLSFKGFAVVTKNGFAVGGVKVAGGKLKNLYPRGLRI